MYFICLQIGRKQTIRDRLGSILTFAWTSILAAAVSACTLFPVLLSQIGNRQAQTEVKYGVLHSFQEIFSKLFTGAYNGEQFANGAPQIYCGILILFLVLLFFLSAKGNIRQVVAAGVLLAALLASFRVGALDIIWHGLAMPNSFTHRYAFVFIFALVIVAEECFSSKRITITLPGITTADVLILALLAWVWSAKLEYVNPFLLLFDAGVVVAVSVMFYLYKKGSKENRDVMVLLLLVVQVVQLFVNGRIYVGIHTYDDHSSEGYYSAMRPVVEEVESMDDGFYRMEKTYFNSSNDPMMLYYNGLSHFSSADKSYIRGFMGSLGYNKNYDFWVYYDKGATLAADSLLGVKYILSMEPLETVQEKIVKDNLTVYENPLALEIGTVCPAQIKELVLDKEEPFVNQEKIFQVMCKAETELFVPCETEVRLNNLEHSDTSYVKVDGEKDGIIIIDFTAKDNNPVYMYLPSVYNPGVQVCVNGEDKGEYLTAYHRGIFELGTFEEGEHVQAELYLHGTHAGFKNIQIYSLNIQNLEKAAGALQKKGWTVQEQNSGKVKAEFTVEEDNSVLFITIPYNENWNITVDGAPAAVTEVLDALIAVDVSKGQHVIRMKYQPKGMMAGNIVSLTAVGLIILFILIDKKCRKSDGKNRESFVSYMVRELSKDESEL